jgi:hypothetical protein
MSARTAMVGRICSAARFSPTNGALVRSRPTSKKPRPEPVAICRLQRLGGREHHNGAVAQVYAIPHGSLCLDPRQFYGLVGLRAFWEVRASSLGPVVVARADFDDAGQLRPEQGVRVGNGGRNGRVNPIVIPNEDIAIGYCARIGPARTRCVACAADPACLGSAPD